MTTLFIILIILACVVLTLIVLVQNPKGGGLAGNIAGFSNQFMGVKQTNDVLEKGTWIFAAVVGLLCVFSPAFIPGDGSSSTENDELRRNLDTRQQTAPATTNPNTTAPLPGAAQPQQAPATTPVTPAP